jgi:hypothetical protein
MAKKPTKEEISAVMRAMGKKGGPSRWKNVSKEERSRLMRQAALKRWKAKRKGAS